MFDVVTKNGIIGGVVSATITPTGGFRFLGLNGRGRKYDTGSYKGKVSVDLHVHSIEAISAPGAAKAAAIKVIADLRAQFNL